MRIDHIAIWSTDIDLLKVFYEKYFNARSNDKYVNTHDLLLNLTGFGNPQPEYPPFSNFTPFQTFG